MATLKSDLQRVNKTITNIMSAIEKGVVTNTTKSRLEELETEQIIRKVSTETHEITRLFKGGTVKTKYYNYDIYVVI